MAKLVVTSRGWHETGQALHEVRCALPTARVRRARFLGVLLVDAATEADALGLAERVSRACGSTGHATAVLAEVESELEPIREAALRVGSEQVGPHDSFCFRITKRGAHRVTTPTPDVEAEIGAALVAALERRHGTRPRVDLGHPDVTVIAEVLGPTTAVGIVRKAWRERAEASPVTRPADGSQ
ncbi:MAG TPA: THUMP domain-containing protein [Gemmatimonadales bacterium]|jgi:tRNA(Ser,Leu) C12 N-acetylase TAN1